MGPNLAQAHLDGPNPSTNATPDPFYPIPTPNPNPNPTPDHISDQAVRLGYTWGGGIEYACMIMSLIRRSSLPDGIAAKVQAGRGEVQGGVGVWLWLSLSLCMG